MSELETIVSGFVAVDKEQIEYRQWNGDRCRSKLISVDTETECIDSRSRPPRLAIAQAFDGDFVYLIHPDDIGEFMREHEDCNFVFHNVSFDWHVIYSHFRKRRDKQSMRRWLCIVNENRLTDTMLLDQLNRIASGDGDTSANNLGKLTSRVLGFEISKDDPWRLRYGDIIDKNWSQVPVEAWEYAAKDVIVTRKVFLKLRESTRQLVTEFDIPSDELKTFGQLTIKTQVRSAIAFGQMKLNGIHIDQERRETAKLELLTQVDELIRQLDSADEFKCVFKRDNAGELLFTKSGKPRVSQNQLRTFLSNVATKLGIKPPTSPQGLVTTKKDYWQDYAEGEPLIGLWMSLEEKTKLLQFFDKLNSKRVHPKYTTLVRTGRSSCSDPNIQQIPKNSGFREMFVPRPGSVFMVVDYAALEIRTLAGVLEKQFGKSVLADTLREGRDPHCYTAAMVNEMSCEEFLALKKTDRARYDKQRSAAKALNFGLGGGMGAASFATYARLGYGVELTVKEAEEVIQRFTEVVYPEVGMYLRNDLAISLSRALKCRVEDVRGYFRTGGMLGATKKIVSGRPYRKGVEPYDPDFVERCWKSLSILNRNGAFSTALDNQVASEELGRSLFSASVVSPGGFIRGRASYCQQCNTPFQSAAATGCKLAAWELFRRGYRVVAFVHDEFVIELPLTANLNEEADRIDKLLCKSMEQVTGGVPVATEYAFADCWSKQAELVTDSQGQFQVWSPDDPA